MSELRTIILAAGKGTRMKSEIPKVLHPVCGEAIIQVVLNISNAVGSLKNYVVLGHQMDEVKKFLSCSQKARVNDLRAGFRPTDGKNLVPRALARGAPPPACLVVEQKKLQGTADAVECAQKYFKDYVGDVLVLCGDTPLLKKKSVQDLIQKHRRSKAACTFLAAVVEEPKGYGRVIRNEQKQVVAIREDKDTQGDESDITEINVGVYCFQSQVLFENLKNIPIHPKKKEFYLTKVIELFFAKNLKVDTLETENFSDGLGVNTREDLAVAQGILRQRILKDFMARGVTIVDPMTTYIDKGVKIGQDTVIRPFTVIEKDVRIGKHCTIGPFARLRPGTRLGNHVEVGNFTEVSRTTIGDQSLMKHFAFLGDAQVGSSVNIGAGVVTANYDGKEKNVSKILDHAFIGSDSILVAPVKIGRGAMTGAGSVVTRGQVVADQSVVVGVPARVIGKRKAKQNLLRKNT